MSVVVSGSIFGRGDKSFRYRNFGLSDAFLEFTQIGVTHFRRFSKFIVGRVILPASSPGHRPEIFF